MESLHKDVAAPPLVNATTGRFANAAPVAGPQFSLAALNTQFAATVPAQAAAASLDWAAMSEQLAQSVASLDDAKASLASSSATSWVQAALGRINQIQWAGGTYAAHASALSGHTTNLATVAQAHQVSTAVAHGTWLLLPTMAQKMAFEQAYLAPFAPNLTTGLVPSNPAFNQLLPPLSDMPGDHYKPGAVSVPRAPEFEKTPLPRVVAEALQQRGFADLARASTPAEVVQQFDAITPDTLGALSEGATPTQAAAVAAPTMPPTLNPGVGPQAVPGVGAPISPSGGGAGPILPGGGALTTGFGPTAGAAPAILGGVASAPRGGAGGAWTGGAPGAAMGRALGGHAPGAGFGNGMGAVGYGAGSAGPSAGRGSAAGVRAGGVGVPGAAGSGFGGAGGTGAGGAGGLGPGAGQVASSRVAGVAGGAGAPGGAAGSGRAYPVGGPAGISGRGAERERKAHRVKAVTSAVERDGNLRALLGEAPALLPAVIGDNVKQPRGY